MSIFSLVSELFVYLLSNWYYQIQLHSKKNFSKLKFENVLYLWCRAIHKLHLTKIGGVKYSLTTEGHDEGHREGGWVKLAWIEE